MQQEFFRKGLTSYDQELGSQLYDLLSELPNHFQTVLDLYYFQGFSVKEISHILGNSQSKVKIDLMRGRNTLKKIIKERGLSYEDLI